MRNECHHRISGIRSRYGELFMMVKTNGEVVQVGKMSNDKNRFKQYVQEIVGTNFIIWLLPRHIFVVNFPKFPPVVWHRIGCTVWNLSSRGLEHILSPIAPTSPKMWDS